MRKTKTKKVPTKKEALQQVNFTLHGIRNNLEKQSIKARDEAHEVIVARVINEAMNEVERAIEVIAVRRKHG